MNDKISIEIDDDIIIAYAFKNEDGYIGIRTEFVAKTDKGQNPGRPAVSLEVTPSGELQALVYDKYSEDPASDYFFD